MARKIKVATERVKPRSASLLMLENMRMKETITLQEGQIKSLQESCDVYRESRDRYMADYRKKADECLELERTVAQKDLALSTARTQYKRDHEKISGLEAHIAKNETLFDGYRLHVRDTLQPERIMSAADQKKKLDPLGYLPPSQLFAKLP